MFPSLEKVVWIMSAREVFSPLRLAFLVLLLLSFSAPAPSARPFLDSHACRGVVEGVMKGDIEAAIAAVNPEPSDVDELKNAVTTMTNALSGILQGKLPRLERTLPDISVDNYPTSLQIWSFGDKDVQFVGCLLQPKRKAAKIYLQFHPSVDELVKGLKANLGKSN